MKENMINERRRNEEFINFLKCQVENYIIELSHKNEQISCLMKLLENNNVNSHKHQVETIPIHRCPTDLASNNRERVNDAKSQGNDIIESNHGIRCNPATDLLTNESRGQSNDIQFQIDKKWFTQRRKKAANIIPLQNSFSPLSL